MEISEKEKIWKTRIHKINIFLIITIIILCLGLLVLINLPDSFWMKMSDIYWNNRFEQNAHNFQDDIEVLKITNNCSRNVTKTLCVYDSIPFFYKDEDLLTLLKGNIVLNPSHFVSRGYQGVCRDIAVFRKAVLNNLGIQSVYVFEPNHVFVRAFEDNQTYELNNGYLKVK